MILTLLRPDTKGNGTGTCKYLKINQSNTPDDDSLNMIRPLVIKLQLTTCISPFSPGRGGHGFERDPFSLELEEQ